MTTLAQKLREIADQVEAVDITGLIPTPGGEVREGDLIWPETHTSMKVDRVEVVSSQPSGRYGGTMLRFHGVNITSPDYPGLHSSHIAYSDDWVVVER